MGSIQPSQPQAEVHDIIVVGAGISGINAGYRIQEQLPDYSYTILEGRNAIGGTWDLFRYPGIRSDSDLHTFGFPWRLWNKEQSIVAGGDIRDYVVESAKIYGIDKKIQFKHMLQSNDWSDVEQQWTLTVDNEGTQKIFKSRFVIFATGYYDYKTPLQTEIPGLDSFQGKLIHPQFWPEDLDYSNKTVVVVGSGATAITVIPSMAYKTKKITMLQRSPTYIIPQPGKDPLGVFLHKVTPSFIADRIIRWKYLIIPLLFFYFCRAFPKAGRWLLALFARPLLPKGYPMDPNFNPRYGPWEQRLCACPDGDFYKAITDGKADIVTDSIEEVTKEGIKTKTGKFLPADIIVTATGLKVHLAGGTRVNVNGKLFHFYEKWLWNGMMMSDLPNAVFVIGYTNSSWTLGADATMIGLIRLIKQMNRQGLSSARPRMPKEELEGPDPIQPRSSMDLNSTYLHKAKGVIPQAGNRGPWQARKNYFYDTWGMSHKDLSVGLEFSVAPNAKTK